MQSRAGENEMREGIGRLNEVGSREGKLAFYSKKRQNAGIIF